MNPAVALTINASDPTGFGGLEADLRTFAAHQLHGASIITAVGGPTEHYPMPGNVVGGELSMVLAEFKPAAVKVGVMATAEIAAAIGGRVRAGELTNVVLDPVLDANGGHRRGVIGATLRLMPEVCVITPNIDEAGELVGWPVVTTADMAGAAGQLISRGAKYVVITGGRLSGDESIDAIWTDGGVRFLHAPRVDAVNVRGTGSTFSAAIAAHLALGATMLEAVTSAKSYVTTALHGSRDWQIGYHHRPLDHLGISAAARTPAMWALPPRSASGAAPAAVRPVSGQPAMAGPIGPRSGVPLPAGP
jgi:hydroxymethylpyrimidine/phosphomethylpyrimidine kinase